MGRNTGRGKVAYSWISPDPAKAGFTLRVVVVVLSSFIVAHKWVEYFNYKFSSFNIYRTLTSILKQSFKF